MVRRLTKHGTIRIRDTNTVDDLLSAKPSEQDKFIQSCVGEETARVENLTLTVEPYKCIVDYIYL